MNLQALKPADLQVGMRIAVSTPFDARVWVKAADGVFVLSPMQGFGESDSHHWAEVQRLDLPYAWLNVDVDEEAPPSSACTSIPARCGCGSTRRTGREASRLEGREALRLEGR